MICYQMRKGTNQYIIRPPQELIDKLRKLAGDYGRPSGNQLALEVITEYLDWWADAEQAKKDRRAEQRKILFGEEGASQDKVIVPVEDEAEESPSGKKVGKKPGKR